MGEAVEEFVANKGVLEILATLPHIRDFIIQQDWHNRCDNEREMRTRNPF